jgi:hypothetical protein
MREGEVLYVNDLRGTGFMNDNIPVSFISPSRRVIYFIRTCFARQ